MIISRNFFLYYFLFFFLNFFNLKSGVLPNNDEVEKMAMKLSEMYKMTPDDEKELFLNDYNFLQYENHGWPSGFVHGTREFTNKYIFKKSPWATNAVFSFAYFYGMYSGIVKPVVTKVFSFFEKLQKWKGWVNPISAGISVFLIFAFRPPDPRNVFVCTQDYKHTLLEKKSIIEDYKDYEKIKPRLIFPFKKKEVKIE
jgi:hypothetical protein